MQSNGADIQFDSLFVPLPAGDQLHLKRVHRGETGTPVLLIPGFIEDGRIFYKETGVGYAAYLAQNGYDVFVADLRGRGKSTPRISRASTYGQEEFITEEMPAYLDKIKELKGDQPVHLGAHSWGGVMVLAYLARTKAPLPVASLVFFASKRRISVRNWPWFVSIFIFWNMIFPLIIRLKGYVDAKGFRLGAENESRNVFYQTAAWVREKEWKQWGGTFDYRLHLSDQELPPALYFAGKKDRVLGNPIDVQILADETGEQRKKVMLLSRENGNAVDYDHINILIHKAAPKDHFPVALEWMRAGEKALVNASSPQMSAES